MQDALPLDATRSQSRGRRLTLRTLAGAQSLPTLAEWALAALSAALLVISFPDFELWPLAWVALVPLTTAVARQTRAAGNGARAFLLGWVFGTAFFYATCWWLTYPMIHYGGIPAWIAYPLLLPAPVVVGIFPALWCLALSRACARWGMRGLLIAPFAWAALEWARLEVTGQLWNAIGYSQAYVPALIQTARWGSVYAVGFLIVSCNAGIAYLLLRRTKRALVIPALTVGLVALAVAASNWSARGRSGGVAARSRPASAAVVVVGVQPNVLPDFERSVEETRALAERHFLMSETALGALESAGRAGETNAEIERAVVVTRAETGEREDADALALAALPRVVVWPESPMNFSYARSLGFRERIAELVRSRRASVLFNSLEPAPSGGAFNSAVVIDEQGRLAAQYDKIRLMPFGEYVPLPRWLPGASSVRGIVGDFTPGTNYSLLPLGGDGERGVRAGVFICFESAFPDITRSFARGGADVLVNISNDAYQGDTPVMRQHLANSVFRAVENGRAVLRVTNTGISALITPRGEVVDATRGFEPAVRIWTVGRESGQTFYTKYGDVVPALCAAVSLLALIQATFGFGRRVRR